MEEEDAASERKALPPETSDTGKVIRHYKEHAACRGCNRKAMGERHHHGQVERPRRRHHIKTEASNMLSLC